MELFHEDGHLTQEGMKAIIEGTLDEMQDLEASEHLSFCDSCLVEYLSVLEETQLLAPAVPIAETVMSKIRKKAVRILFNKYTTVAVAAGLVVAMWSSGFIGALLRPETVLPDKQTNAISRQADNEPGIGQRLNQAAGAAGSAMNHMFDEFLSAASNRKEIAEEEQRAKENTIEQDKADSAKRADKNEAERKRIEREKSDAKDTAGSEPASSGK